MYCLTVKQPWASLIALGAKHNETRSWYTNYRGPLAIHASARMSKQEKDLCFEDPFRTALLNAGLFHHPCILPLGSVIALVNLVDCLPIVADDGPYPNDAAMMNIAGLCRPGNLTEPERSFGDYTPGRFAWVFSDVRQVEPVKCRGRLGLWNLPQEVEEEVKDA